MTILDYILEGIEAELALERELGVRSVECDMSVLAVEGAVEKTNVAPVRRDTSEVRRAEPAPSTKHEAQGTFAYDFVFLHDRALSADGVTMMAKIVTAMGKTAETAPIVFTGELPKAKAYVVLGGNALKKWFPDVPGSPGQWVSTPALPNILVTYSPAYILRFGTVTPAVQKLKREMWMSLKSVLQRVK